MDDAMKLSDQLSEDYRKAKQKAVEWGFRPALVAAIAAVVATDKNLIFGIFTPSPTWIFSWVAILEFSVMAALVVAIMVGVLAFLYYQTD